MQSRAATGTSTSSRRKTTFVPRVVDEVLRQVRQPGPVVEPELVLEPAGRPSRATTRATPRRHRRGRRRDERRRHQHRVAEPRALLVREVEPASEEVRTDDSRSWRSRVGVPLCVAPPSSHRLRDERVHDNERRERDREEVGHEPPERAARAARQRRGRARQEQSFLPRGDHGECAAAHAGAPEHRHHEVVEREPDDEHVQRPHGAAEERHAGPDSDERHAAIRVHAPRKETATRARFGPRGSSTSSKRAPDALASRPGQPVHEREQRVHLEREPPVRRRHEDAPCDAAELVLRTPLPSRPPATCSTTAFEKPMSNAPSANGSSRPSARTACTCGNAALNRSSSVCPTAVIRSGHGYIASKKLSLEPPPNGASVTPTSTTVVSRPRREQIDEQTELPLAASQRHLRGDPAQHRRSVRLDSDRGPRRAPPEGAVLPPPLRPARERRDRAVARGTYGRLRIGDGLERVPRVQRPDGTIVVAAESDAGVEHVRFALGLDDDHSEFLGASRVTRCSAQSVAQLRGLRPMRPAPSRRRSSAPSPAS